MCRVALKLSRPKRDYLRLSFTVKKLTAAKLDRGSKSVKFRSQKCDTEKEERTHRRVDLHEGILRSRKSTSGRAVVVTVSFGAG